MGAVALATAILRRRTGHRIRCCCSSSTVGARRGHHRCASAVAEEGVMEIRQLMSFLAVLEEGQFALAAKRLFLSPPAVTAHVQGLEKELGTQLLVRSPVEPTVAGRRLAAYARTILEAEDQAIKAIQTRGEWDDAGTLRIGVMGHGSAEITPAVIRAYSRVRPNVRTVIQPLTFREHVTALVDDRVDVAFVRPAPDDSRVVFDVMTNEPRIVIVSTSHALAHSKCLTLDDVLDLPYLDLPPGTPKQFCDFLYFADARNGVQPNKSPDTALTPHEVLTSTAAGRGAGSSLYSFGRFYRWPGTTCIPVVDAPYESSVLAARANDRNPDVVTFRQVALAIVNAAGKTLVPDPSIGDPRPC